MKPSILFSILIVGVATALTIAPARAQSVAPCAAYTCMAGMSGEGATGGRPPVAGRDDWPAHVSRLAPPSA